MKRCTTCLDDLDISLFNKIGSRCKDCTKIYKQQYHIKNKELIHEKTKKFREENKEKIFEQKRKYREENKETIATNKKEYKNNNREKENKRKREFAKNKYEPVKIKNIHKNTYIKVLQELIRKTNFKTCTDCKLTHCLNNYTHSRSNKEVKTCINCRKINNERNSNIMYNENTNKYYREVLTKYSDDFKKGKQCIDCGENNWLTLEYDHIDRTTKTCLVLQCKSIEKMQQEIDKCVLRCSFCHQLKSIAERGGIIIKTGKIKIKCDFINNIKLDNRSCVLCERKTAPDNLHGFDFDHIDRSTKVDNISAMVQNYKCSIKELEEELNKCRLLCRNCHKVHTLKQLFNKS